MSDHSDDPELESELLRRVVAEFLEMPGLQVTPEQARRLWGCDAATCQRAAALLVDQGVPRWSGEGRLARKA